MMATAPNVERDNVLNLRIRSPKEMTDEEAALTRYTNHILLAVRRHIRRAYTMLSAAWLLVAFFFFIAALQEDKNRIPSFCFVFSLVIAAITANTAQSPPLPANAEELLSLL